MSAEKGPSFEGLGNLGRHQIKLVEHTPGSDTVILVMSCGLEINRRFDPKKQKESDLQTWVGLWVLLMGASLNVASEIRIFASVPPSEEV